MFAAGVAPGVKLDGLILPSLRPNLARLLRQPSPVRLLFWECDDHRVVQAASLLSEGGSIRVVFLGDQWRASRVPEASKRTRAEVLPMTDVAHAWGRSANPQGSAAPQSPCELAAAALSLNLVDTVVGGVATSSADVLRAGLKYVGLLPGTRTVSISGFVEPVAGPLAGKLLIMTDTGAVIDPTVEQFVDIARNAIRSWNHVSDERPRVAFVTASTRGSLPALPILGRVRRAVQILGENATEFDVDGELQLDAAVVPRVAASKSVGGSVAGRANILVFPGIDSCNIGYKIAEHIGGALTVPVTQGFARSFHDVSRGAELSDLIGTCVVAAIMGSSTTDGARVS